METLLVSGTIDEQHVLSANVPESFPPGPVAIVILPLRSDKNPDQEWMEGIAREWSDDLGDPRQDIYTLDDGLPVNAT